MTLPSGAGQNTPEVERSGTSPDVAQDVSQAETVRVEILSPDPTRDITKDVSPDVSQDVSQEPTLKIEAPHADVSRGKRRRPRLALLMALGAVLLLLPLFASLAWIHGRSSSAPMRISRQTPTPQGPFPWSNETRTTAPNPLYAVFARQQPGIAPAFQAYYQAHGGESVLGPAVTPGYPTDAGYVQIFRNAALLLPASAASGTVQATPASLQGTRLDPQLIGEGVADSATGIVRVPLLHALLTAGSNIPLAESSALTYVNLREATSPENVVRMQTWRGVRGATSGNGIFIAESTTNGIAEGHTIPLEIWTFITQPSVAPDGWEAAFGKPLTEALPTTISRNGQTHRVLIQAFWLAAVLVDLDAPDANGLPAGQVLPAGLDYLSTFGPPPIALAPQQRAWLTELTALKASAGGDTSDVHLGENTSLTLTGASQWVRGALWYQVAWRVARRGGQSWVHAAAVSLTAPPQGAAAWAGFDAISPSLQAYLNSFGNNVGAMVFDVTRNQYYAYNADTRFTLASSSKVSIMVAYLSWLESQDREADDSERYLMSIMIQNSDNNAAQTLYDRLGDGDGMAAWMRQLGLPGYQPHPGGWGWGMLPVRSQVKLLTMLQQGTVLTAEHRAFALGLMRTVEDDQRNGVGDTLPKGATVAMKDGWVPAPDGLWAVNTSGIVTAGSEVYIIAVYTQHQTGENAGWAIARHVCSEVGKQLVP